MCVYIYIYIRTHTSVSNMTDMYVLAWAPRYLGNDICIHIYMCLYTHTHTHVGVCMARLIPMHRYGPLALLANIHAYTYTYLHTHPHTHTRV